jgi:predicted metal-dependent phosphoesterase TrpH
MLNIDFHTHTSASKDSLTSPEKLIQFALYHKLDRVIITDHNTIAGARAAYILNSELIIVGEEIMTTNGEILAAFVNNEIPSGLSPQETIHRLRDQGAFISVSHPFDNWRSGSWKPEKLLEIVPLIDAIETFNARCMTPAANQQAVEFANRHGLPGTAGSDAHITLEVGRATVSVPQFNGADELRKVIREGKIRGGLSPFWVHFFSYYARYQKKVV